MENGSEPPKPVGIITDRDLVVEVMATGVDFERVSVGDVMSFELMTAGENDGIWDTVHRMRSKGVRRIPVVDAQGALVGILSMDDPLDFLVEELSDLIRWIRNQTAPGWRNAWSMFER
ncbi:MAG: CBS domain-containing protein [Gammaproteobacteria bacterium]